MRLSTNDHVDCLYQTFIKEAEFNTFLCFLRHGLTLNVLYTYDFFLKNCFASFILLCLALGSECPDSMD